MAALQRATQALTVLAVICGVTAAVVATQHAGSRADGAAQIGSQSFPRPLDSDTPSTAPSGTPSPSPSPSVVSPPMPVPGTSLSLPAILYQAYLVAEAAQHERQPGCRLHWQLLAAIGQVESGQAHQGAVDSTGKADPPIYGPVLDGGGAYQVIRDTDGGRLDGNTRFDRAVGPLQFVPGTWRVWGADGSGDHVADPQNAFDAALSAGRYLCADDRDLSKADDLTAAVLSYNHSQSYVDAVLKWMRAYAGHLHIVPSPSPSPSSSPSPSPSPSKSGPAAPPPSPSVSVSSSVSPPPSPSTSVGAGSIGPTPSA
ncbi:lytic transglycosylase domain-containing protein [Streptomyces sp. NPDC001288]|uniref:lytic transglycosylase domain-containing protein n=1 Tax=unclassified Streptomyces TaxID=2593676 RepID=UPI00332718F4